MDDGAGWYRKNAMTPTGKIKNNPTIQFTTDRQPMHIIAVDLQRDFTTEGGACYHFRPCLHFIREILIPFCRNQGILVAEIKSDYRQPRSGAPLAHCEPGTPGYESDLSDDVRYPEVWIKCMHSPVWVRENGGLAAKSPGPPYPDPMGFTDWLTTVVGPPAEHNPIVLVGLTLDCCVLCTAQELFFRGYQVEFLVDAVDTYNGNQEEKQFLFQGPLVNWGRPVSWQEMWNRTTS